MGQELPCRVRAAGRSGAGTACLESTELRFRGAFSLKIALKDVTRVTAAGDELVLTTQAGETRLTLGPAAALWARKIQSPKPLIDKLGVKPGMRVAVMGVADGAFAAQLAGRKVVRDEKPAAGLTEIIFLGAEKPSDLRRLETLRAKLGPTAAIWIVSRKGKDAPLKDTEVIAAGRAAGLVDNKVVAFSASHTALRFSLPKAARR